MGYCPAKNYLALMSVRTKVVVELGTISVLTTIFLVLFPRRNLLLDLALAGFALICIAASARFAGVLDQSPSF